MLRRKQTHPVLLKLIDAEGHVEYHTIGPGDHLTINYEASGVTPKHPGTKFSLTAEAIYRIELA